jgi:pimeloyl-ACP methyl ester carboxylesterase
MNDLLPCGLESTETCAASRSVTLAEALERLKQEAVHGVCDTGRYRCSYHVWGQGPALVFIPGLCDDALSFVWPAALLCRDFRCILYDPPIGRGDRASIRRYRHEDLVADLFALLDHLGARRAYLFGSSFGSTVALRALQAAPERFPRAVLQGGFAYRPLAPAELLLAHLARYWPGQMRQLPLRQALLRYNHYGSFASRGPDAWDYLLRRWGAPPIAAVAQRALLLHRVDLRPFLPQVRQPVLLVCGEYDPLVGKSCEKDLLHGLPNARRLELEGCGHAPCFSHPELLAEVVRRFLLPPPGGKEEDGL